MYRVEVNLKEEKRMGQNTPGSRLKSGESASEKTSGVAALRISLRPHAVPVAELVDVVDHGDEQVEEHAPAALHLGLHRAGALECGAAADDEGEVVRAQARVRVRRVRVRVARRREDRRAADAALQALLAQRELLQAGEAVLEGRALVVG
jgi:hypothetical protein